MERRVNRCRLGWVLGLVLWVLADTSGMGAQALHAQEGEAEDGRAAETAPAPAGESGAGEPAPPPEPEGAAAASPAPGTASAPAAPAAGGSRALADLEGTVVERGTGPAEGDLPVVTLALDVGGDVRKVALAPESVLEETGFEVAVGDRVRARVFVDGGEVAAAQKVLNLSRDLLLRLRTFNRQPIWDAEGRWEGSGGSLGDPSRGRATRRPQRRPPPSLRPPPPARPPPGR